MYKETEILKDEVATDSLTGAGSRSFGDKILAEYLNNFKTSGRNYTIAIIDIDDFKAVNDRYGHYVGDEVIKNMVDTIKKKEITRKGSSVLIFLFY